VSHTWTVSNNPDTDSDGMPDAWEQANGTNPSVNDAGVDADLDGLSNLQEYLAGTSPTNALSVLHLDATALPPGNVLLTFDAVSNRTYTIESRLVVDTSSWTNTATFPSAATNRFIELTNSTGPDVIRFFRLLVQP